MSRYLTALLCFSLCSLACAREIDFAKDVRPILADNCFACHGPDENTREADLRLDVADEAAAVLSRGDSELLRRITSQDPDEVMPPPTSKKELNKQQIDVLQEWIEQGAEYSSHWAFTPPRLPQVPPVELKTLVDANVHNEIDHFVINKLRPDGMAPSPPTDKATLLRRVTLDLTGMPPSPKDCLLYTSDAADE